MSIPVEEEEVGGREEDLAAAESDNFPETVVVSWFKRAEGEWIWEGGSGEVLVLEVPPSLWSENDPREPDEKELGASEDDRVGWVEGGLLNETALEFKRLDSEDTSESASSQSDDGE